MRLKINISALTTFFLFLFVLAGAFSIARIGLGDFEVRHVFFLILIGLLIVFFLSNKSMLPRSFYIISPFIFFYIYMMTSIYSFSMEHVIEKLVDVVYVFCAFAIALIIFFRKENMLTFLMLLTIIGSIYSVAILMSIGGTENGRGSIGIGGPNVATRVMFLGFLSLLIMTIYYKKSYLFLLSPLYIAGIVGVGSRGGLISAILALSSLIFFFITFRYKMFFSKKLLKSKKFFVLMAFLIICLLVFLKFFYNLVEDVFKNRFVNLVLERVHFAGRDTLYSSAWENISEHPIIGMGLSGYRDFLGIYPHNLFLEIMLEGGGVLTLFLVIIIFSLFFMLRNASGCKVILIVACFYMVMVQMFSGGFYDFRYFFVFYAMALMWDRNKKIAFL